MSVDIAHNAKINTAVYQFAQMYLEKRGWFESLDGIPRNKDGVVPWITYPAYRQLLKVVRKNWRVFEYGCGGSSIWWAGRVAEVISVEHDAVWASKIAEVGPANLKVVARVQDEPYADERREIVAKFLAGAPLLPMSPKPEQNATHGLLTEEFGAYATEITEYEKESFDVIVVDGMARALTAWLAPQYIKPSGLIIFDNSDRPHYNGGYHALCMAGFRRIDFFGPGPVNRQEWCTSFFVKNLDIFANSVFSDGE